MITLSKKAIVFTAFDRVDYLKQTLESWSKVRSIQEYDIYFKVEPSDRTDEVCDIINDFAEKIGNIINVNINNKVMGCAANTWFALDKTFEEYEFVILAEDDIMVSEDVCEYFNYLENKYRDDLSVGTISASGERPEFDPSKVLRVSGFQGLIWGTWRNVWLNYFKDTWDWNYSSGNGGPSGWDWNLNLRVMPRNHLFCIVPHTARSLHIGVNGLHSNEEIFDGTQTKSFKNDYQWEELIEV
jgi:hypothetical protein